MDKQIEELGAKLLLLNSYTRRDGKTVRRGCWVNTENNKKKIHPSQFRREKRYSKDREKESKKERNEREELLRAPRELVIRWYNNYVSRIPATTAEQSFFFMCWLVVCVGWLWMVVVVANSGC